MYRGYVHPKAPLPADHPSPPIRKEQVWTSEMTFGDRQALARKVENFIAEIDPFGDKFSSYELGCIRELIER